MEKLVPANWSKRLLQLALMSNIDLVDAFDELYSIETRRKIYRVMDECVSTTIVIMNSEKLTFNSKQFVDIFDQILPTAFVLNNGYWPFFQPYLTQSKACICDRFLLKCKHHYSPYKEHCIRTEHLTLDVCESGTIQRHKSLFKLMKSIPAFVYSYSVTILIDTTDKAKFKIDSEQHVEVNERYQIIRQVIPAPEKTVFYATLANLKAKFNKTLTKHMNEERIDKLQRFGFIARRADMCDCTLVPAYILPNRFLHKRLEDGVPDLR